MNNKIVDRMLAVIVMIATAHAADADTVSYDESVNGDLPFGLAAPTLAFEVGTNMVTGTLTYKLVPRLVDMDTIRFSLPSGTELSSIVVTFDSVVASDFVLEAIIAVDFGCDTCLPYLPHFLDLRETPTSALDVLAGLSPSVTGFTAADGLFFVDLKWGLFVGQAGATAEWRYRIDATVSAIPLPAPFWLLGTAVLALVGAHRRGVTVSS